MRSRADSDWVARQVAGFWQRHARDLAWRRPGTTPWGVLVSEVMLQQTQVSRVEPRWRAWMERWPTPGDLAGASPDEVLRAWGGLGYPRRALRLMQTAQVIVEQFGGQVPDTEAELLSLPGVGPYTAGAVLAFAFQQRGFAVDTNVRRVVARVFQGRAQADGAMRVADWQLIDDVVPNGADGAQWMAGVMELGALICTARSPACDSCPLARQCVWFQRGRPAEAGAKKPSQQWAGSNRQLRGRIMAALRNSPQQWLGRQVLLDAARGLGDQNNSASIAVERAEFALQSLEADGLVLRGADGQFALPRALPSGP